MNKNVNYGTINKMGGAKNRLFKFVLCFCLGVVSLLGIGAKMTANAQVLDIDTEKIVTSDNEYLSNILSFDYDGYFDIVGYTGAKIEFRLYYFDGSVYDYNQWYGSSTASYFYTPQNGIWLISYSSGFAVSTYQDLPGFCINLSSVASYLSFIDVCTFRFYPNGISDTSNIHYFCSKQLYNQYLTMQNSSSGYTDTDLQNSYNNGYNAGLEDNQDTIYNSGYNTGYSDCQKDMVDDLQQEYQNGYGIGKGEGINEGYNQGYESGYSEGLKDNQDLIYNTGYNDGYSTGEDDGYNNGYHIGYTDSQNDKNSFKELMFSIVDAPFNVLSNAFDFEIFGINMSSFLIAIVSLLLVSVVIRKLM